MKRMLQKITQTDQRQWMGLKHQKKVMRVVTIVIQVNQRLKKMML